MTRASLRAQAGGSTDEVAALIAKAVAANPSDSVPRQALIAHYLLKMEPKKAVAAAQDALAALPDRPEILDAAGQAYRIAGDSNQAISIYNKLVQVRPESTLPFMRIAEIQIAQQTFQLQQIGIDPVFGPVASRPAWPGLPQRRGSNPERSNGATAPDPGRG